MKLKKIASLALVGIMAVSMLAGCSTTSVKPEDPETPNVPVETDGVSADVAERIKAYPEYVSFADDADLDKALTYAVQYAGAKEVANGYIRVWDKLEEVSGMSNVGTVLQDTVGVTKGITVKDIGDNDTLVAVEKNAGQAVTLPAAKAAQVYVLSGEIEDMARDQMIADAVNDYIQKYQYVITDNDDNQGFDKTDEFTGGNFKFSYKVSVSVATADAHSIIYGNGGYFEGVENPDVTFVAVQVVRTAEHQ